MRACHPDHDGYVERDGVKLFYEVFGEGEPTILLLPTWSIIHSRHWKMQIAFLSRHFTVVCFDGRGNGRSSRPSDPNAYADSEFASDTIAVMQATGIEKAILIGAQGPDYTFQGTEKKSYAATLVDLEALLQSAPRKGP